MKSESEYQKYLDLKALSKFFFKDYNLSPMLSQYYISHTYDHIPLSSLSIKEFLVEYKRLKEYKELSVIEEAEGVVISHSNWRREDYRELVTLVHKFIPSSRILEHRFINHKKPEFFICFLSIIQALIYFRSKLKWRQRLALGLTIAEIKIKIKQVEQSLRYSRIKAYIAFNSSLVDDAIICSVLNKKEIPTYSLQHGFYGLYSGYIPMDIINYENIVAKKLLCWGQSTFENMVKFGIDPARLSKAGNPRIPELGNVTLIHPKFKRCLVLLGRYIYHDSNLELLKILKSAEINYGIQFFLKLHPSLALKGLSSQYKSHFQIVNSKLQVAEAISGYNCDFAISNNTSAFFDCKINGLICFRFGKFENEEFGEEYFKFDSQKELENLFREINKRSTEQLQEELITTLCYHFYSNPEQNYQGILNEV